MRISECAESKETIDAICNLNWAGLTQDNLQDVATGYYYFSVQFRESLHVARELYPNDEKLRKLEEVECNTDNLSPWLGVVHAGEKIDHDEFMRRLLVLSPVDDGHRNMLDLVGQKYLRSTREVKPELRAGSIASYEDGGLERVFKAILKSRHWDTPALHAFKHFLIKHIQFDSEPEHGHGALSRHLIPDDGEISPMWSEFKRLLVECAPELIIRQ